MKVEILYEAEEELAESINFYEEIEAGLGLRLKEDVRNAIRWIASNSSVPRLRRTGYQRVNLPVFRHYIAYFVEDDTIWILAIAHSARRPDYWISRKNTGGQ